MQKHLELIEMRFIRRILKIPWTDKFYVSLLTSIRGRQEFPTRGLTLLPSSGLKYG